VHEHTESVLKAFILDIFYAFLIYRWLGSFHTSADVPEMVETDHFAQPSTGYIIYMYRNNAT